MPYSMYERFDRKKLVEKCFDCRDNLSVGDDGICFPCWERRYDNQQRSKLSVTYCRGCYVGIDAPHLHHDGLCFVCTQQKID